MTEHDRVLDAFRNCITEPKCKDCPWTECETIDHGTIEIPRDLALAVMRELVTQEPRVMTDAELIDKIRKAPIVAKPAVDAAPVVHGRWTTKRTWKHDGEWYCSVCDYEPIVFMESNYCPSCGARMDKEV